MIARASSKQSRSAPDQTPSEPGSSIDHRLAWARALREVELRSLASDFLRGIKDECTEDAYNEYQRRLSAGEIKNEDRPLKKRAGRSKKAR